MFADCQISNEGCLPSKPSSSQKFRWGKGQHKRAEQEEAISSSFTQDLIEELTLRNSLLVAQLSEYRVLVASLTEKLRSRQEACEPVPLEAKEPAKLRTIQEVSTMSEVTNHSGRREIDGESECFLHDLSTLLGSHSIEAKDPSWDSLLSAMELALAERSAALSFLKRVQQMKQSVEPGVASTPELWGWLRKIAANYHCLLSYQHSRAHRPPSRK